MGELRGGSSGWRPSPSCFCPLTYGALEAGFSSQFFRNEPNSASYDFVRRPLGQRRSRTSTAEDATIQSGRRYNDLGDAKSTWETLRPGVAETLRSIWESLHPIRGKRLDRSRRGYVNSRERLRSIRETLHAPSRGDATIRSRRRYAQLRRELRSNLGEATSTSGEAPIEGS